MAFKEYSQDPGSSLKIYLGIMRTYKDLLLANKELPVDSRLPAESRTMRIAAEDYIYDAELKAAEKIYKTISDDLDATIHEHARVSAEELMDDGCLGPVRRTAGK